MISFVGHLRGWGSVYLVLLVLLLSVAAQAQRLVTDQLGREVVVPTDPQRVVCLAPNLTEMIFALGQGHRVVGVSTFSNRPSRAGQLPKVGSYVRPDVERIAALKPDLCLATRDGNPLRAVERIESLGIPVFAIDPRNLDGVMDSIEALARLLGAGPRGEALVQDMQSRLNKVRYRVANTEDAPRVLYLVGTDPMIAAATRSFAHELILTAGGANVLDADSAYPRVSMEEVVVLSPEVIILSTMQGEDDVCGFRRDIEQWVVIPAVKDGRIHRVDSDLFDRPSPRSLEAVEILFDLLHAGTTPGGQQGPGK